MQIRQKLTFQFVLIVASIFIFSLFTIYYFSAQYRKLQFIDQLTDRANSTVRLLIDVDEVDSTLLKIIDRNNPSSLLNENVAIYNYNNRIIYCNNDTLEFPITDELKEQVKQESQIYLIEKDFEIVGLECIGKKQKYTVFAGAKDIYGIKKITNLRTILIIVFILGVLIVLFSGWFYAGRALSPISKMIKQADNISISNINQRLDEGNQKDELSNLANTINNLLNRLENAIILQRKFVANASHELRTPLTAIMGQLEVSLLRERDKLYYQDKISSVIEDIKILIQTSNQLLSLAQVSSDESEITLKPYRIDDIIVQSRSELINRYPDYRIDLEFNDFPSDEKKLLIYSNEILLKTAFQNLLDNGCKFSSNKKVNCEIKVLNTFIVLSFKNEGIAIEASDLEHIFQPFYRGNNVKNIKGSGLGLSIVEKIIELHKGNIKVTSIKNKSTVFVVTLPIHQA